MKIYIDLQKNAITRVITKDDAYEGDIFSNVFELMFFNYTSLEWFPTMSQIAPNNREAGDFVADSLTGTETHEVVEDGVTYLKYTFTISDGWVLMKGRSNFFVWVNTNRPTTRKCVGKVMVTLNESSNNFFIQDPMFNPSVKEYIDSIKTEQDATIAGLGQLQPSGVATSSEILSFTEDKGIYVSSTNGHWYYWDATLSTPAYKDSGMTFDYDMPNYWVVQSSQLTNYSGNKFEVTDTSVKNQLNSNEVYIIKLGIYWNGTEFEELENPIIFYMYSTADSDVEDIVYRTIPIFKDGVFIYQELLIENISGSTRFTINFNVELSNDVYVAYRTKSTDVTEVLTITPDDLVYYDTLSDRVRYQIVNDEKANLLVNNKINFIALQVKYQNGALVIPARVPLLCLEATTSTMLIYSSGNIASPYIYYHSQTISKSDKIIEFENGNPYITKKLNWNEKANSTDVYVKQEIDEFLDLKADKSTTYTKTEVNTLLGAKADATTTASGIAASGHSIVLSINNTTYVLTAQLLDANNNVLNTQTIDLPLETMVVNGSYNDQTKKIVLTLQSGSTIEFSVADLIDGLVALNDDTQNIVANSITLKSLTVGTRSGTTGDKSVAFGSQNTVSGAECFAQGFKNTVDGWYDVAFGQQNQVHGLFGYANGQHLITHDYQNTIGIANIEDSQINNPELSSMDDAFLEIVGCGEVVGDTVNARDNARVLTWLGNEYIKGDLIFDTTFGSENVTYNGTTYKRTTKQGTSLKTVLATKSTVLDVNNITALTTAQINSLKCGDIVNKVDSTGKHSYRVTYKKDNTGICLTYCDASVVETVSYDYVSSAWVYNSTDIAQVGGAADVGFSIVNGAVCVTYETE